MSRFFKISELSKTSGVNLETIRYYEKLGLIDAATRQANGYRLFSEKQLNQLSFIKSCRMIGFSLEEIKQLLELQANPQNRCEVADKLTRQHLIQIEQQIAQLNQIKAMLEPFIECQAEDVEHCQIIKGIKALE